MIRRQKDYEDAREKEYDVSLKLLYTDSMSVIQECIDIIHDIAGDGCIP